MGRWRRRHCPTLHRRGRAGGAGRPDPVATLIADLIASPEFRPSALLRDNGLRSVLCVPVISGGSVWGVLEVASTMPAAFDADDERFLVAMANILGVAVDRAADYATSQAFSANAAAALSRMEERYRLRLTELQHRMKNTLAVVSSMLVMEQVQHTDAYVKERLNGLVNRVGALALAHEQLSANAEGNVVELAPYLSQLANNLALLAVSTNHGLFQVLRDQSPVEFRCRCSSKLMPRCSERKSPYGSQHPPARNHP